MGDGPHGQPERGRDVPAAAGAAPRRGGPSPSPNRRGNEGCGRPHRGLCRSASRPASPSSSWLGSEASSATGRPRPTSSFATRRASSRSPSAASIDDPRPIIVSAPLPSSLRDVLQQLPAIALTLHRADREGPNRSDDDRSAHASSTHSGRRSPESFSSEPVRAGGGAAGSRAAPRGRRRKEYRLVGLYDGGEELTPRERSGRADPCKTGISSAAPASAYGKAQGAPSQTRVGSRA